MRALTFRYPKSQQLSSIWDLLHALEDFAAARAHQFYNRLLVPASRFVDFVTIMYGSQDDA